MTKKKSTRDQRRALWGTIIIIVLAPVLIPLVLLIILAYLVLAVLLHVLAWLVWNTRGIRLLYVYSNSPNWQDHIENNILPRLPERSIVLNWSERKKWQFSLTTLVFRHFGGHSEFNPIAIVFRPFRWAKVFRFFKPFRDLKHGQPDALQKMEAEFFAVLDR